MRTTIDLPDPLFREVKATAAVQGLKLKDFVANSLRSALLQRSQEAEESFTPQAAHRRLMEAHFQAMTRNRQQTGPVGTFDREELHDRRA